MDYSKPHTLQHTITTRLQLWRCLEDWSRSKAVRRTALIAQIACITMAACAREAEQPSDFTVKSSIELSRIVDPTLSTIVACCGAESAGSPIHSPDGRYFLLVTERGDLAANTLEGTIWLFDQRRVGECLRSMPCRRAKPKKLVVMQAVTNLPVINGVRWSDDSKTITFLAKDNSPYQRLFTEDIQRGTVRPLTTAGLYVTAYDIRTSTIAYTVLNTTSPSAHVTAPLLQVGSESIYDLLDEQPPAMQDFKSTDLLKYPSWLRVLKDGKDVRVEFKWQGQVLQLYIPTLSLSDDGKHLVTVAPVRVVPEAWEEYQPLGDWFRFKPGPVEQLGVTHGESAWRPEQYVLADLETGSVSPLVDAPVGRDMGFGVPTQAFWLSDNRRVILTNTYQPLAPLLDQATRARRSKTSALVLVDIVTNETGADIDLHQNLIGPGLRFYIDDMGWSGSKQAITLRYKGIGDDATPPSNTFVLKSGTWIKIQEVESTRPVSPTLSVCEDLNHPPVLCAHSDHAASASTTIWDPNPKLSSLRLGRAFLYHWHDKQDRSWSGIVVLPPNYNPTRRYPLVIQTHGYIPDRFFADGTFTTGSGGRAFAAKNIIVLQMDMMSLHLLTPEEAPDNLAGFESAISHLAADGFVDPERVGIVGFSATCFHVLYALINRPTMFRAASITDGQNYGYMEYMLLSPGELMQRQSEAVNGGPPFGAALLRWLANSPNFNLDKVRTPLLMAALERGNLLDEWETYAGLRKLHKPVAMLWWRYENTDHNLVQPAQRYASQQSAVDWFDYWLNDDKDPDITKRDRYSHWDNLRALQAAK